MVKWYHACRVTRYRANVLTCDHAITLADESARLRFTVVKWCRGAMVVWYRGVVVVRCLGIVVAWYRDNVVSNYHGSNAPEYIHARASCKLSELRAASWSRNQKFNIILTKRAGKIFCHN